MVEIDDNPSVIIGAWVRFLLAQALEALVGLVRSRSSSESAREIVIIGGDQFPAGGSDDPAKDGDSAPLPSVRYENRTLVVTAGNFVERRVAGFKLPDYRLRAMGRMDVEAATPFTSDSAYAFSGAVPLGSNRYLLVKKSVISEAMARAQQAGNRVDAIWFETSAGPVQLTREEMRLAGFPVRRTGAVRMAFASVLTILLAVTAAHYWMRCDDALTKINARLDTARSQAHAIRAAIDEDVAEREELATALAGRLGGTSSIALWEELSRIIPDTAWLTGLRLVDAHLSIEGYAREPAELISAIESSRLYASAAFSAPIVAVAGQPQKRFAISAAIEPQ